MKQHYLILVLLSMVIFSCDTDDITPEPPITYADGEFPEKIMLGSWVVKTQTQINEFGARNFTGMTGNLKIDPGFETSNFAIDLTPLRSLDRIEGTLTIKDNPNLTSLEGLHNINWLGELFIQDNASLENLDGLRKLDTIAYENSNPVNGTEGQIWIRNNASLSQIDGLFNLTRVVNITIANNPSLQNLDGLQNITQNTYLRTDIGCGSEPYVAPYCGNSNLSNFCGLQNLFTNGNYDSVRIAGNAYNPSIQDIINGNCSE